MGGITQSDSEFGHVEGDFNLRKCARVKVGYDGLCAPPATLRQDVTEVT